MDLCKLRIELHHLVDTVDDPEILLQVFVLLNTSAAVASFMIDPGPKMPDFIQ